MPPETEMANLRSSWMPPSRKGPRGSRPAAGQDPRAGKHLSPRTPDMHPDYGAGGAYRSWSPLSPRRPAASTGARDREGALRGAGQPFIGTRLRLPAFRGGASHHGPRPGLPAPSFTGCTLRCGFCQNWQTSSCSAGPFVSGSSFGQISPAAKARRGKHQHRDRAKSFRAYCSLHGARGRGLSVPMVWNYTAMKPLETVALLAPEVSFFLPDLKTSTRRLPVITCTRPTTRRTPQRRLRAMAELGRCELGG